MNKGRTLCPSLPLPQAQQEAIVAAENFIAHTPLETQAALGILEVDVQLERNMTLDNEIDAVMVARIPNTGSSRSRDTKYNRTIDLYWHMKGLLGRALKDKQAAQNELYMQLEYIQLQIKALDRKVYILAEKTMGLSFNSPNEETPQVSGDNVPSPPI